MSNTERGAEEWVEPGLDALSSPYALAASAVAELRRRNGFLFTWRSSTSHSQCCSPACCR